MKMGVPILGTAAEDVDAQRTESSSMRFLRNARSESKGTYRITAEEAKKAANELGYRYSSPSYVLGGQGMQIAICDEDIDEFIGIINRIARNTDPGRQIHHG